MRALILCTSLALAGPSPAAGQGVPEAITVDGVPPVPADLVAALSRYQNTRSAAFRGWVAGRREALIVTRFGATNQVHKVAFPGGARTQLTFLAERVLSAEPRPGGTEAFAFTADEGGAENYQLFVNDPAAGAARRLTDGVSRNVFSGWSNAGNLVAFSGNARNGRDTDLYVADPADPGPPRRFKEVAGDWTVNDWSPDDRTVVAVERVSIHESYVHLVDVATGRTETLTPRPGKPSETVAYDNVRFTKDGKALLWTTDAGSEFQRLARFDLATKASTVLTGSIPWDVESFDLADDGRTVVLAANEDGTSRVHVVDAVTGRLRTPAAAVPPGQIAGLKFRKGSAEFGFSRSSAREAGDVYSYDLATETLTRWTASETGGLLTSALAEPTLVRFPASDGRPIPAFVYRADPARFPGKRPVVVDIHGGPESQARNGFLGRLNYLIDGLGLTVIFPNVRGSAGYGKSYLKLDNGVLREGAVRDIGALLDWVGTQPDLDAGRVAVIGGSYGGYMTLASLTHYGDRFRAAIDVVGVSNFVTLLETTSAYRRDLRRVEYGDERDPAMREFLTKISPLTNASKIKVPLLVAAGKNDPRVPVTESEQIAAAVRKGGLPVWYVVAANEGHGFARKENQDYLNYAEALFLSRFLLGSGG